MTELSLPDSSTHETGTLSDPAAASVIAVSSGKGGVGKTWLAVTLSHALACAKHSVLLLDGDLGLANVDVQLGLTPRHDIASTLEEGRSLDEAISRFDPGAFDVLAGRSGSGSLAALSPRKLDMLCMQVHMLAQAYDHTILDIGAGIDRTVRVLAAGASRNIVVTTDEPTALTDAYAFIKVMAASGNAGAVEIVINMASGERQGEHTYQTLRRACAGFLKISPPLAGIVRRDPHVNDAIRHQMPLLTRYPNCNAARDIEALARHLGGGA